MPLLIKVPIARADVRNGNGRVYPKAVLEKAAQAAACAQLPVYAVQQPGADVTIKDVAGFTTQVAMEGHELKATLQLADTVTGKALQEIIGLGYEALFTTRGIGTLGEDGVVQDDYVLESVSLDWQNADLELRRVLRAKMKANYGRSAHPGRPAQDNH